MGIADELEKLRQLRETGSLTEAEFDEAKRAVLRTHSPTDDPAPRATPPAPVAPIVIQSPRRDEFSGAADRYFDMKVRQNRSRTIISIIGLVVGLILMAVMFSSFSGSDGGSMSPGLDCNDPMITCEQ